MIVLTLAWPDGAQDSHASQETDAAAWQIRIAEVQTPADGAAAALDSDVAAAVPRLVAAVQHPSSVANVEPAADAVMAPPTAAAPNVAAQPSHEALQRYRKTQGLAPDAQMPPGGRTKRLPLPPPNASCRAR
ncbi:hypothetical protein JZM24_03135 [Candidatus Sodalis endolongispinus]|uniref:Uncharacterized protein n=1 Tax=Candidatus Sodalis endolongispinus TaxID=2812662 RepID=A0ABS5Y8R4_9GAMM|nr:hypothetical protein [Candidatus Sodalis endolongispinus]MBT9431397.1 hypothetical protein [Candidatus Sodalis endolongispinus]